MKIRSLSIVLLFALAFGCDQIDPPLSFDQQLEIDVAKIDEYLETNNIDAVKDGSGLRYKVLAEGSGLVSPSRTANCIKANYKGLLFSDNTEFDKGTNIELSLPGVIQGWQIAFERLQVGDSAVLYIPSGLGYGARAQGAIPANAILVFGVKLNQIGEYDFYPPTGGAVCWFDEL
jgi:FKBP-type peptidyl-prolyl cis-trans isomerase